MNPRKLTLTLSLIGISGKLICVLCWLIKTRSCHQQPGSCQELSDNYLVKTKWRKGFTICHGRIVKPSLHCTRYDKTLYRLSHYRRLFRNLSAIFQCPSSHVIKQNGNFISWVVSQNIASRQVGDRWNYLKLILWGRVVLLLVWKFLSNNIVFNLLVRGGALVSLQFYK